MVLGSVQATLNRPKFSETLTVSAVAGQLFGGRSFGRSASRSNYWTAVFQTGRIFQTVYFGDPKIRPAKRPQKTVRVMDRFVLTSTKTLMKLVTKKCEKRDTICDVRYLGIIEVSSQKSEHHEFFAVPGSYCGCIIIIFSLKNKKFSKKKDFKNKTLVLFKILIQKNIFNSRILTFQYTLINHIKFPEISNVAASSSSFSSRSSINSSTSSSLSVCSTKSNTEPLLSLAVLFNNSIILTKALLPNFIPRFLSKGVGTPP
ncbi:hypothetical protein BpHYR1_002236 [Brachionus plicatilis]|uniref:Uncharacterized protein n=1 Tax=Brachionus plicatilis TaxID=10195 RepID=A0A3M7SEQ0_BRAPC|nr:hypothetical protein BpHYR1_002236 [Brachionus plicatilis]